MTSKIIHKTNILGKNVSLLIPYPSTHYSQVETLSGVKKKYSEKIKIFLFNSSKTEGTIQFTLFLIQCLYELLNENWKIYKNPIRSAM